MTVTTNPHPAQPAGWVIGWGEQLDTRPITVTGPGEVTDVTVAAYPAKYATKSTEVTGHTSGRLSGDTVGLFADPDGRHPERLVDACWMLGAPRGWRGLRHWAHMLGFGGHYATKSRRYSVTFGALRAARVVFCRTAAGNQPVDTTGPSTPDTPDRPTALVVNFLQYVGGRLAHHR